MKQDSGQLGLKSLNNSEKHLGYTGVIKSIKWRIAHVLSRQWRWWLAVCSGTACWSKNIFVVWKKLEVHFLLKKYIFKRISQFISRMQELFETVDQYVNYLYKKSEQFDWKCSTVSPLLLERIDSLALPPTYRPL